MARVLDTYATTLAWGLRRRWIMALITIATLASVAIPMNFVTFDTFPQEAGRRLLLNYNIDGTYSLQRVEQSVDQMEEYLFANQEEFDMRSVYSYFDPGRAQSVILLTPKEEAEVPTGEVIRRIEERLCVL